MSLQSYQTKISRGFSLIINDTGHRKSGNLISGVRRQYIEEIVKIDNGIVAVISHFYDGKKSLPLYIELYQKAGSLAQGKAHPQRMSYKYSIPRPADGQGL